MSSQKKVWLGLGLGAVLLALLLVGGVYYLLQPSTPTARIRDVMIILLAVEGLLIGVALLVLVVQMGLLLYVLHEEIRPILRDFQEAAHTLKGTSEFVSEHVARPVIRAKGYVAMVKALRDVLRWRSRRKSKA